MPREAMSVATSTRARPLLNASSARDALALRAVRVQRGRGDLAACSLRTILSAPCLVRENTSTESRFESRSRCASRSTLRLFGTGYRNCATSRRAGAAADLDRFRVVQELAGDLLDVGRQRRREEHRLPNFRQRAHDAADLREEAHVEHAIGLVEDAISTCASDT